MITNVPIEILPIEDDGFHLMLKAKINGKKANLIIDTGASRTVFDEILIKDFLPKAYDDFETNEKLSQMEQQKDDSQKLLISKEQEEEIKNFQEEKRRINKELKKVRRNLRADIEALGVSVKLINIFLIPLLVAIAGIAFALHRRRKSQRV